MSSYVSGVCCPICAAEKLTYWVPTDTLFCEGCRTRWDKDEILGLTGPIWLTRDGRAMPINKMEERHLRNSIARIWRSGGKWRGRFMGALLKELEQRTKIEPG